MRTAMILLAAVIAVWGASSPAPKISDTHTMATAVNLSSPSVDPDTGFVEDNFLFEVTYTSNLWNLPPAVIKVVIDGTDYDSMVQVDPTDSNYTDGAEFFITLPGSEFGRGTHEFYFYAEDDSGANDQTDTFVFVILNTPPSGGTATLSWTPATDPPRTYSTIFCNVAGFTDPDSDAITYAYRWYVNYSFVGITWDSLPGTYFEKGDTVYCLVYPYDGYDFGSVVSSDTIIIENTPPLPPEITIDPDTPYSSDDIAAVIILPGSDIDGDAVTYIYNWYLFLPTPTLMSTASTLDHSLTNPGDVLMLNVIPFDGEDAGDTSTVFFFIDEPHIYDGYVTPDSGHAYSTLFTFGVTYFNNHNYPPESIVVIVDDSLVFPLSPADPTDHDYTDSAFYNATTMLGPGPHQFRFFAVDDHGNQCPPLGPFDGPVMTNELPVVDSVILIPDPATVCDTIFAIVGWHDDDGDAVTLQYDWFVNGAAVPAWDEDFLPPTMFNRYDTVWCVVTPFDGFELGAAVSSDTLIISNYAPVADSARIRVIPPPPTEISILRARVFGVFDCDGDHVSISYQWFINGNPLVLSTATRWIDGRVFDHGDTVYFVAKMTDGIDTTEIVSPPVVIQNTPPEFDLVAIHPMFPRTDDSLFAIVDAHDIDDDSIIVSYKWYRNGVLVSRNSFIPPEMTSHFEHWTLVATIHDDFDPHTTLTDSASVTIRNTPPAFLPFVDTVVVAGENYFSRLRAFDIDMDSLRFGLVRGPDGLTIDPDGVIHWDVPDTDAVIRYSFRARVTDGYSTTRRSFRLWSYPITAPLFAPRNLVVTTGYSGFIPLSWEPPLAFDLPVPPVPFEGYEVWRSLRPDSGWERIATTFVPNYIDNDVTPYIVYYYKIVAIYSLGSSHESNIDHGFAVSGPSTEWYSNFTYRLPPVCDGDIYDVEWEDASRFTYSSSSRFEIMFKHTLNYLYIAVIAYGDTNISDNDALYISIDDNFNRRWPTGSPSNEGEYRLQWSRHRPELTFQGIWGDFPTGIGRDTRISPPSLQGGASDDEGYVTYEIAIPLFGTAAERINIARLNTWIGLRIAAYDADAGEWVKIIPSGSDAEDPAGFGSLYLGPGEGPGNLCDLPRAINATVREGETALRFFTIRNCGGGYLSYDIQERCALVPTRLLRATEHSIIAFVDSNSLIPRALATISYPADIFTDPDAFCTAASGGDYELVIVSADSIPSSRVWDGVERALRHHAKVLIQTPDLDSYRNHLLWGAMGVAIGNDLGSRPSAITLDLPWHPFFRLPMPTTEAFFDTMPGAPDYGDCVIPGPHQAIATFDRLPYPGNGAIITNFATTFVINALKLSNTADADTDGIPDALELLVNEILALKPCNDVEWLDEEPTTGTLPGHASQVITVTFDATHLTAGHYYAFLMVHTNDFHHPLSFIPVHLQVTEPEPRPLILWFNPETLFSCHDRDAAVDIMIDSLEAMRIRNLIITVENDPAIAQPVDVVARQGSLVTFSVGPGRITFEITNPFPLPGGGPLATVFYRAQRSAEIGEVTPLTITNIEYNTDAYVTDTVITNGNLIVWGCDEHWRVILDFECGGRHDTVILGVEPRATSWFDSLWDEDNTPLVSWFDAYTVTPWDTLHQRLATDIRSSRQVMISWRIHTGDSAGTLNWSFPDFVNLTEMGALYLVDGARRIDMKTVRTYDYSRSARLQVIYRGDAAVPFRFGIVPGFSMISLPIRISGSPDALFPGNFGCWSFDAEHNTWEEATNMIPGVGYALLHREHRVFEYWGHPIHELELELARGWNFIGTIYDPVNFTDPDDVPDGAIIGMPYHAWYFDTSSGTYVGTDNLIPGLAYFVLSNVDGARLYLPGGGHGGGTKTSAKSRTVATITKDDLTLKLMLGEGIKEAFMPPTPDKPANYKAYIDYNDIPAKAAATSGEWILVVLEDGEYEINPKADYSLLIDGKPAYGRTYLSLGAHKVVLDSKIKPAEPILTDFAPNPFNAKSVMTIWLGSEAHVQADVYDISGKLIRTIENNTLPGGYHKLIWDGTDDEGKTMPSGVYMVRISIGKKHYIKKLILAR